MAGVTITYALKTSEQERIDKTGKYTYSNDIGIQDLKVEEAKKHFKDVFVFEDTEDKTIYIEGSSSAFQCIQDMKLYPLFRDPRLFIPRKRREAPSSYGSILAKDFLEALKVVEGLISVRKFSHYKGLSGYALSLFLGPYISHLISALSRNLEAEVLIIYNDEGVNRAEDEVNINENPIVIRPGIVNVEENPLLQGEIGMNRDHWVVYPFDLEGPNVRIADMNDINI